MVAPRIGNWLSSPVSCPPSPGATTATVVVTAPEITIRAGRSHFPGVGARLADPAVGQYRTITAIPPNATIAPATGGTATTRTTIARPR